MDFLDRRDDILRWNSEEVVIPYRSSIDGRIHRYFVDFWVEKLDRNGNKSVVLVEVKPYKETVEPKKQKKMTKSYLYEVKNWAVNTSKWKAAHEYCQDRGWKFMLMTERELGIKY